MNKNLFKIIFVLLLMLFGVNNVNALSLEPYYNETSNYKVVIEDDANLLNEDELDLLKDKMIPLTDYGNVVFKTISYNYTSAESYASRYYHELFSTDSGTLFLIDIDNRMLYIFSDGDVHKFITNDKAEIITDNVYTYASDEDYYKCASVAFEQILTVLQGGKINEPMRYISNFFIAITISFFMTFIYILIYSGIYKASNNEILDGCDITFTVGDSYAAKTGQSRVYSPQSSSSGGSSSGGGGGGGGSSGGGGGHRF